MKRNVFLCTVLISGIGAMAIAQDANEEPTWDKLSKHPVPEWFKDAKFGIYAHWGVYSVPAFGNEWYPRNMYVADSATHKHHVATYADPSEFGYKDFIPMFKGKYFDADEWAELYQQAGARFAGPVAEHHDGFSMWDSQVNRWNAADMGPRRDITGELVEALRERDIKIITSFHHAYNIQGYYTEKVGWDTGDPKYGDLYGKFADPSEAHERWFLKIKEVIDKYQPDQIWFDFGLGKTPDRYKRPMAAYYYGKEAEWGKPLIITRKHDHLPEGVGVLDIERGKMEGPADFLWQTDDSVAINSWCWVENLMLKSASELVHELIDIVSKNGVLLLNVCPKADGTIPADQRQLLLEMGRWLNVNGEAIYATRPWLTHGEGPHLLDRGRGFSHAEKKEVQFDQRDIRFTRSKDGRKLYAICLGWPERPFTLQTIEVAQAGSAAKITLLGHPGAATFQVDGEGKLTIEPPRLKPDRRPCRHAYVFKLEGFRLGLHPDARFTMPDAVTLTAQQATLEGDELRLETLTDSPNIGWWNQPNERVHWLVRVRRPGHYAMRGEFATATGATRLALSVAGQTLRLGVPNTGGWDRSQYVEIGELSLDQPGVYHVILEPADPAAWRPVNVWSIQMAPAASE